VDDVVVVVVEDQGNVEFLTYGEEIVDGPGLQSSSQTSFCLLRPGDR
jgi:hypothetical protein